MAPVCSIPRILAALPGTKREICARAGISPRTADRYLKELREGENRCIRIARWLRPEVTGSFRPVYDHGSAPDAKCALKKQSNKARWEVQKKRMAADIDLIDRRRAQQRARHRDMAWRARAKAKPQGPFAALGL